MRGMGGGGSGGGADGPHCGGTVLLSASKAVSFCGLRTQKACHPSPLASMVSSLSHLHTARRWRVRVQLQRVHSFSVFTACCGLMPRAGSRLRGHGNW